MSKTRKRKVYERKYYNQTRRFFRWKRITFVPEMVTHFYPAINGYTVSWKRVYDYYTLYLYREIGNPVYPQELLNGFAETVYKEQCDTILPKLFNYYRYNTVKGYRLPGEFYGKRNYRA